MMQLFNVMTGLVDYRPEVRGTHIVNCAQTSNRRRRLAGFLWIAGFIIWVISLVCVRASSLVVDDLFCENLLNPLGIDAKQPRLSWVLRSGERGMKQSAYRILVASEAQLLTANKGDLWDSGKVASDETAQIEYAGQDLKSRQHVFWAVTVWDQNGQATISRRAGSWEMGLLAGEDWQGKWLTRNSNKQDPLAPQFRRDFKVQKKIRQARFYICGLGYYEIHVNGQKVGDHLLDPGYTDYDHRILYASYDVTSCLTRGINAIGVILGNGWYNVQTEVGWGFQNAAWRKTPQFLLKLDIQFTDGTETTIVSDESWKCATGPIVYDNIYGGETYDARLEKRGWDLPGYVDSGWQAVQITSAPKGRLVAQQMPPIKAGVVIKPVSVTEPKPGVYVFDLGQNLAGYAEWHVNGPVGAKCVMKYGERLATNGLVDRQDIMAYHTLVGPNQQFSTDTYFLNGKGKETWHARFDYKGFQYVEVTGLPNKPTLDTVRGVSLHSAVPVAGEFYCSNPMLNQIWQAARWSYLNNLQGIPTDCPHREKNGWTGDAHLAAEQAMYNFMPSGVYEKWLNDFEDVQWTNGELPAIVPTAGFGYAWGNGPAWDSAFLIIPYYLYQYYGDAHALADHYEGMKRYVDYLTTRATNGILSIGLGDWCPADTQTPVEVTSTAYYYEDAQIVSLAASIVGHPDDAVKYADLAAGIKSGFNLHFYDRTNGLYANGSQTALSCALYQGLVEPENRTRVLDNLVRSVERKGGHIDTGILGAKYVLNALLQNGRSDVAYQIVSQTNYPGWGWWMKQGATTLWEGWNGGGSRNHAMFGDVSAWFYKALAGINADPTAPGFKHIIVRPNCFRNLNFVHAKYNSIHGPIISEWRSEHGKFHLLVDIPANTTATVSVPAAKFKDVQEGGKPAVEGNGISSFRQEPDTVVFEIGSGRYQFNSELPAKAKQLGAAAIWN